LSKYIHSYIIVYVPYKEGMGKMDKIVLEVLQELRDEEDAKGEKKAYYANFPGKLYEDFEKAIAPVAPTKFFQRVMAKVVQLSKKK